MFNQKPCKNCGSNKHLAWRCPHRVGNPCSYCGKTDHDSLACFDKPRVPMGFESSKTHKQRLATKKEWRELNPPDEYGNWYCYLQISPNCPKILTAETLTQEHVMPKVKAPERRFDVTNIAPACNFCNTLKGSRTLEKLALTYPQLQKYL